MRGGITRLRKRPPERRPSDLRVVLPGPAIMAAGVSGVRGSVSASSRPGRRRTCSQRVTTHGAVPPFPKPLLGGQGLFLSSLSDLLTVRGVARDKPRDVVSLDPRSSAALPPPTSRRAVLEWPSFPNCLRREVMWCLGRRA